MNEMKEKIFDMVFDETEDAIEVRDTFEAIEKDPELKKYYLMLKKEKEALNKNAFVQAPDDLLEANRARLSASISEMTGGADKKIIFSETLNIYGKKFLQYAAVILLTFYATMFHFNRERTVTAVSEGNTVPLNGSYQTVSSDGGTVFGGIDMSKYKVENLNIEESGSELVINFDVSTNKVIRGAKNDPAIMNTLKYLVEHENNSGVKYKTMKAMDISENGDYTATLLKVMTNDKDPIIRRKAMKMIEDRSHDEAVREALYKVVLNDSDQTNRVEALGILETTGSEYAGKALRTVSAQSSDYFRFKAEELDLNEKKGQ
ncbi:MAG: HEAT repeat domain-containing protein [Candidatus Delongbacteria bacterium]|nr:HEAT repeat domain-containing protein [Candidatus Delongbacteria bacterium]